MKKQFAWIGLEGLRVRANHGVHEQERVNGNDFVIDLSVYYDISKAVKSDRIKDALDYEELTRIVEKEMAKPAYLLEYVARRIVKRVFRKFKAASRARIRLVKNNPPLELSLSAQSSYVQMDLSRKDF